MEPLWSTFDRVAPCLHAQVALLGKFPAGALSIAFLLALWLIGRWLAVFAIVLPGALAGGAVGVWLYFAHGWHPLPCVMAGLGISAAISRLLMHFFYLRVVIAVIGWPLAVLAIWHLAAGSLDTLWAFALTLLGAVTLGSVLLRFVETDNHDLYVWVTDLIADIRGD